MRGFSATVAVLLGVISLTTLTSGQALASASKSTTTFDVAGGNMEPTLQLGERVTVDREAYRHHRVRPGDIIVFASPPTENCGGSFASDLISRVIGLPGQAISLSNGYVFIDRKRLDETWLPASVRGTTFPGPPEHKYSLDAPYKVPADSYFVMGDNRADSCDSRYWGPVAKVLIVGKVEAL